MYNLLLADITVLSPFVDYYQSKGGNAEAILEDKRIPLGALERGSGKITKMQFYSTVAAMAHSAGAEDYGYQVGQLFQPKDMGGLGKAVMQASTLLDALHTLQMYVSHWVEGAEILLQEEGDDLWLIDPGTDGLNAFRCQTGQATVFLLTNIVRMVAGADWSPKQAKTEANYVDALHIYQDFSETEFFYQAPYNSIAIPKEFLSLPMPRCEEKSLVLSQEKLSLHDQLKLLIRTHLLNGQLLHARDAAEITGVSERSFLRQLAQHGVSYRQLLDRSRYEIATELLNQGISTTDAARLLHYSGPNNFIRAFKRITGLTPQQWQRK